MSFWFRSCPDARGIGISTYYASGLISNSGLDPSIDDVAALGRRRGYHFPPEYYSNSTPALMLVFKALARLPLMAAYWIWVGAGILAFAMAISLLIKIMDLGSSSSALLVGIVLLYPPVIDHLWYAESEFVFLFLLVLAFWLLRAGKDVAGGALLALVALLKVYPAVMGGYLFATRRWKAFASAIVAGIAGRPDHRRNTRGEGVDRVSRARFQRYIHLEQQQPFPLGLRHADVSKNLWSAREHHGAPRFDRCRATRGGGLHLLDYASNARGVR